MSNNTKMGSLAHCFGPCPLDIFSHTTAWKVCDVKSLDISFKILLIICFSSHLFKNLSMNPDLSQVFVVANLPYVVSVVGRIRCSFLNSRIESYLPC